jgi:DNA topoisomerase IB
MACVETAESGGDLRAAAEEAGLVYVDDGRPGLTRRRSGTGFRYLDAKGAPVRDKAVLARIRSLAIPPAYTDVWICPRRNGHIQATASSTATTRTSGRRGRPTSSRGSWPSRTRCPGSADASTPT